MSTTETGTFTQAEVVRKYNKDELIDLLRGEIELLLDEDNLRIIEKEKITGRDFLNITKEKLRSYGMAGGPSSRFADFAKELGKRKLRAYSSYRSMKDLKEVLGKYGVNSNDIQMIPQFMPEPVRIDDNDEELKQCITDIKRRIRIMGSITGSNEAARCEYIVSILYAFIFIVRRITKAKIILKPQSEVDGNEATGRVDYVIKKIIDIVNEELIAITEGKQKDITVGFMQNIMQLKSSYDVNTKKRKASQALDDDFDYLYGIVMTGMYGFLELHSNDTFQVLFRGKHN